MKKRIFLLITTCLLVSVFWTNLQGMNRQQLADDIERLNDNLNRIEENFEGLNAWMLIPLEPGIRYIRNYAGGFVDNETEVDIRGTRVVAGREFGRILDRAQNVLRRIAALQGEDEGERENVDREEPEDYDFR